MFDKKIPAEARVLMDEGPGNVMDTDMHGVHWDPKHHKAEIQLDGDPRYDPKLVRARQKQSRDAAAQALLNGAPAAGARPVTGDDDEQGTEDY
jgi:hypothetical protein